MTVEPPDPDTDNGDPVVAAIERVLKIEREGVEMLRRSTNDAQRLLSETRARAAALARRTDNCISKLQTAYLHKIERDICALEQAHEAASTKAEAPYDAAALAAAARRLAAKLTEGA
jgi:hypothetical protein